MKREIKFRAWVTINSFPNEMVYDWCKLGEHNHFFGVDTTNERPDIGEVLDVMQYTGLKDKNGKEAYFSDTVNAKIRDANGVVFDVIGTIGWGEFEIQLEMESDYWPVASWSLVESFEITGNIHQNPELIID